MNLAVFGGTGRLQIVKQALQTGHKINVLARVHNRPSWWFE